MIPVQQECRETELAPPSGRDLRSLAPVPLPQLSFEQASNWDDVLGAASLLYHNYLEKGLIKPNKIRLRFTHYNLLPETATFVAKAEGCVIATLSLVVDTKAFGLPMEELYSGETGVLRAAGLRLAEISGFAVDSRYQPVSVHLMMNLVKMVYTYAAKLSLTDFLLACHPKHARLYERLFLFEKLGGLRYYGSVNDAPAVAVRLDLQGIQSRYRAANVIHGFDLYRFFFSDEIFRCPATALRVGAFSQAVIRELCALQPQVIAALEARQPGIVDHLTGWSRDARRKADLGLRSAREFEAIPAFVAAA